MERKIIEAKIGMVLTDGEIYGKKIYLAVGESADRFYEITDKEYWKLMAESGEEE